MVNERLVREGLAYVWVIPPNLKHYDRLLAAQRDARADRRGSGTSFGGRLRLCPREPGRFGRPPFVRDRERLGPGNEYREARSRGSRGASLVFPA